MRETRASTELPVLEDKFCRPRALDNPLRRLLLPARHDLARLDPPIGGTGVDLGAGVGFHVPEWLRRLGPRGQLFLVDPDQENLDRWRAPAEQDSRIHLIVGSAAEVPAVASGTVDSALLSLALCCLVEKERVLAEAWRVLRPGGRLLVTFPRSYSRPSRRRPLRLTVARWNELRARQAWRETAGRRGAFLEWHLLEKSVGRSGA
jgi:SAM-dependent methyltransferase